MAGPVESAVFCVFAWLRNVVLRVRYTHRYTRDTFDDRGILTFVQFREGWAPGDRTPNPRTPGRSLRSVVDSAADLRLSLLDSAIAWCRLASAAGVLCP